MSHQSPDRNSQALVDDKLDTLDALVPIAGRDIVELGCGAAKLARSLLERHPDSRVTGLEVDERQHAKNLASPRAEPSRTIGLPQSRRR